MLPRPSRPPKLGFRVTSGQDVTLKTLGAEAALEKLRGLEMNQTLPASFSMEQRRKYRTVNGLKRESLRDLIGTLPDEDTDIYILSNGVGARDKMGRDRGAFDFGAFLAVLMDMVAPGVCAAVYVSTWTLNKKAAAGMVDLMEAGRIGSLVLLTDPYLNTREPEVAYFLLSHMAERGYQYVGFKNHAKIIAVGNPVTGRCAVVTGSANLSSQPRVEQFIVSTSPQVFKFFVENLFEWAVAAAQRKVE